MRWPSARPKQAPAVAAPAEQASETLFAAERLRHHLDALADLAADGDGVDVYLAALAEKHARIRQTCSALRSRELTLAEFESTLDAVFTARRWLYPAIVSHGVQAVSELVAEVVFGDQAIGVRLQRFVDMMPGARQTDPQSMRAAQRVRRAAWDFACELLHACEPRQTPLFCRWVWDARTQSGALRELLAHPNRAEIPALGESIEAVLAAQTWLDAGLRTAGIYRQREHWADLVLAQAYVCYLGAATQGHFGADFIRSTPMRDQLRKLLGIDAPRGCGRSRVRLELAVRA